MSNRAQARGADSALDATVNLTGTASVQVGRFRLDDQILGDATGGLWRAFDEVLKRMVLLRLIPPTNPDQDNLRIAACAAARVVDPSVARVLDVLDHNNTLVIVSEWAEGIPLEQLVAGGMAPARALQITSEVAQALENIHNAGTAHGRVRPASVLINEDDSVRLRGHTVDARLWGICPGNDPVAADISGLGSILMACLTGRWGGDAPSSLPMAPVVGGKRALPSQLRADLDPAFDEFVVRAMAAVPGPEIRNHPHPFETIHSARENLATLTATRTSHSSTGPQSVIPRGATKTASSSTVIKRAFGVAVVASVLLATAFYGARLILPASTSATNAVAAPTATPSAQSVAPTPAASTEAAAQTAVTNQFAITLPTPAAPTAPAVEQVLPVFDVQTLQGKGGGLTKADFPGFAADADPATAWYTPIYKASKHTPKGASGIVLDLGTPRPINAVSLGLIGNNTDVMIKTSDTLESLASDYKLMATANSAPALTTIRVPNPVTARYVLVLLTAVPWSAGGYRGGITTVHVQGT